MTIAAPTARVNRRGAARWRERQHPWIYRSDVIEPPRAEAGHVLVIDERNAPIGMALWSPTSTISLRMLTHHERAIDEAFWHERIGAAVAYREELAPRANAYRLVHGEGDGLPSLVVDRYDEWLVVQLLSAGLERHRDAIVAALRELTGATGILARNDVPVRDHERLPRSIELLHGTVPEEVEVRENDVAYLAAPWTGQKTGAFLDQRENRARAGELARGRALDCFSYHGSFALHVATNADEVTAVDSSVDALQRARENAVRNGFAIAEDNGIESPGTRGGRMRFVEANVFDFLRTQEAAREAYDTIVLDPPAFAKRKDAVERALRGYKEINLRAMRLLSPGGRLLTFTCSHHVSEPAFRSMLEAAAADAGRPMRWIEARGQAADHPVIVQVPESSYLKGAVLQAVD
ncbi:MAG TPA: class I SAM-dependent rRNA methyltransferase [Longimicrobiales bacterium]|nr:class I SAM-dependent rRNA methyltransferase [Longimicrobiales bacterium]